MYRLILPSHRRVCSANTALVYGYYDPLESVRHLQTLVIANVRTIKAFIGLEAAESHNRLFPTMLSLSQSFPKPNPPSGSAFSIPVALPGSSPESTSALIETLKENHERYHIYFNDQGFHKYVRLLSLPFHQPQPLLLPNSHLSHHVLALWSLGATAAQIRAASARDAETQRPAVDPPEEITEANFSTHIGDEKCVFISYVTAKVYNRSTT